MDVDLLLRVIEELKKRRGKVKAVAKLAGLGTTVVHRIMTGATKDPGFAKVIALAKVLGLLVPPNQDTREYFMMRLEPASFFDAALIGVASRIGQEDILAYDKDLLLQLLIKDGMSAEDALEHFEYNIIGSWVGEGTPIFVSSNDLEAIN